jgi:hypothetical protein
MKEEQVELTYLDEIAQRRVLYGRLIHEGDYCFAVANDHLASIPKGHKILIEEQELEPLQSRNPNISEYRYRKTIPNPWK